MTGFSRGFLSLVERGRSSLALTSLQKIATALGTDIASLFPPEVSQHSDLPLPHITHGVDGQPEEIAITGSGRTYILLSGRAPDRILEPVLLVMQPSVTMEEPYGHEGEEFLYVLEGELVYIVAGERYPMRSGDSIHIQSNMPHTLLNESDQTVRAIFVTTPRFF